MVAHMVTAYVVKPDCMSKTAGVLGTPAVYFLWGSECGNQAGVVNG